MIDYNIYAPKTEKYVVTLFHDYTKYDTFIFTNQRKHCKKTNLSINLDRIWCLNKAKELRKRSWCEVGYDNFEHTYIP